MNVKRRLRGPGVALLVAIAGSLVASAPAGAAADFTWSGGGSTANWSDAGNWRGGSAPAGSVGTLAFPAVGSCPSCYGVPSDDDITGLSANSLSIDDSFSYGMFGSALTLGAGGITAAPTSHSGKDTTIGNDIILGWPQTWAIAGDGQDSQAALTFTGTITGGADLTVDLSNDARMSVRDVETGTITINGAGVLTLGTSINGTSTDPVIVEGGASLRVGGAASIGPLRLIGGGHADGPRLGIA